MAISTYVNVPTLAVGDKLTAARWNTIRTAMNFLLNPPEAVATNTAGTSIPNNTETVIPFPTEDVDTGATYDGAMHSTSSNTSRIVFTTAGRYQISGLLVFTANATGRRTANLRQNAAGVAGGGTLLRAYAFAATPSAADFCYLPIDWEDTFAANDYVELFGFQTSGAALTLTSTIPSYLRARLVGS